MSELPKGWMKPTIDNVLQTLPNGNVVQLGWSPQCESYPAASEEWGVLKTTAIQHGSYLESENKKLPNKLEPKSALEVQVGDILMTCAGPRNRCGVTCFVKSTRSKLIFSGKIYRFRANVKVIVSEYLEFFLMASDTRNKIDIMKTGINDSGLNLTHSRFLKLQVDVPPLGEQKRIVEKIEQLFSELDKGIESLKAAREQLKIYRQSVLKHAFEGKLTENWRKENASETIENYLDAIGAESSTSKKLPNLPDSWHWIKSGSLFSFVTSGSRGWAKYYSEAGAIFIRIGNMDFDSLVLDLEDIQHVSPPLSAEGSRTRVIEGDFLFSITGYLGMFAIAPHLNEAYVSQHIALARPVKGFNQKFLGYYITSKTGGNYYLNGLNKGAVKAGLRLDDIRSFPVPICSIKEQNEVVKLIEEKISGIDNLEAELDNQIKKSEALRQSILKTAFSGKLVPQDPNDEPASVLLERIKADAIQSTKQKKGSSRGS